MTKQEAIELENRCDKLMSAYLKRECSVALSLGGKFKVLFDDNAIVLNKENSEASWVKFQGDFSDLQDYIDAIIKCLNENKIIFDELIWSYNHLSEIE